MNDELTKDVSFVEIIWEISDIDMKRIWNIFSFDLEKKSIRVKPLEEFETIRLIYGDVFIRRLVFSIVLFL